MENFVPSTGRLWPGGPILAHANAEYNAETEPAKRNIHCIFVTPTTTVPREFWEKSFNVPGNALTYRENDR
jgi:hypothetical protein